jgi:sulfatase modifying factor 1
VTWLYRSWALACLLAAGGCKYHPSVQAGAIACRLDGTPCPDGLSCLLASPDDTWGLCKVAGSGAPDAAPAEDAMPLPRDRDLPEQPAEDMQASPPDVALDLPAPDRPADQAALEIGTFDGRADVRPGAGQCPSGQGPEMVMVGKVCIDTTEVTNTQYEAFLDDPVVDPAEPLQQHPKCAGKNPDFHPDGIEGSAVDTPGREDHPVVNVDWCDAWAYCRWAGKRLCGKVGGGALAPGTQGNPDLSQWAYACTNHGMGKYPWGAMPRSMACNLGLTEAPPIKTQPVASLPKCSGPDPRIFDLIGNAEEWIDQCRPNPDPTKADLCAYMGGSYTDSEASGRCDHFDEDPRDDRWRARGFRCCAP